MHCSALIGDFFQQFYVVTRLLLYNININTIQKSTFISALWEIIRSILFKMFFIFLFYIEKVTI